MMLSNEGLDRVLKNPDGLDMEEKSAAANENHWSVENDQSQASYETDIENVSETLWQSSQRNYLEHLVFGF